jgi:hypothetical protein
MQRCRRCLCGKVMKGMYTVCSGPEVTIAHFQVRPMTRHVVDADAKTQ